MSGLADHQPLEDVASPLIGLKMDESPKQPRFSDTTRPIIEESKMSDGKKLLGSQKLMGGKPPGERS